MVSWNFSFAKNLAAATAATTRIRARKPPVGVAVVGIASPALQGRKCLGYLNPYVSTELQICDDAGRWMGVAERVNRICKTDTEALARRYGHVRKIESALLAPVARRGAAIARERIEIMDTNARLLSGRPVTIEEKQRAADTRRLARTEGPAAVDDMLDAPVLTPASDIADPASEEIPW